MNGLPFAAALIAIVSLALAPAPAKSPQTVVVLYAGSLVTPMEGPIAAALASEGIRFQGEPGGSKKLANLITGGLRNPDVFISADARLVMQLRTRVASAVTFAGTSLGIGWSDNSRFASRLARAGASKKAMLEALATPGLRIARTDPQLDPKGVYTIEAMKLLAGTAGEERILGAAENPAQIFPEEDLLVRIDTGQADVGFFYKTEAIARGLHFAALPGAAAMTDKITYTLAIMKNAPHPAAAKAFARFLLGGQGKAILEKAGIGYLRPARVIE